MPKVTVITPNYNHARYLPRRLDSILAQTLGDFELIVLDNASTDDSRRVIESYLHDPRVRAVFNEQNNGNVFKQWNLGLRRASGEYVWIAEADDYAEPTLLETLVDRLDRNPGAGLAVCQSQIVDEEGRMGLSEMSRAWAVDEEGRTSPTGRTGDLYGWHEDFVATGRDFCLDHMYRGNKIMNASAVLFRRSVLQAVGGAPEDMRLSGDYMTYVKMLCASDIVVVAAHLNYFRCHPATTRATTPNLVAVREVRTIQRRINDHFGLGEPDRFYREKLPGEVGYAIARERRPPHDKVPPWRAVQLLYQFARLAPEGFGLALRMLAREQAADLARRLRLLGLARALKGAVGSRR